MKTIWEVDLRRPEEEIFGGMTSACRRCIRKAEKVGVTIEEADDLEFADDYYAQLRDVFAKQRSFRPMTRRGSSSSSATSCRPGACCSSERATATASASRRASSRR